MPGTGAVVVVGGTRAIGLEIVRHYLDAGDEVVLTGRDPEHVEAAVAEMGGRPTGVTFDLAEPASIAAAIAGVGPVRRLVLAAIDRDQNNLREYDVAKAIRLVTLKLVGYTEVVHTLLDRLTPDASVVLFGGMAKERPYPGSTTVTTVNGGVVGLTRTLVEELRPIRVNSIHPGIVGDSPYWAEKPAAIANYTAQTPLGRLTTMSEIVDAVAFLLENGAVNGVDLIVDGGWHCR
ncbi:MAG TPA: SDR family oxidoreductase [Candidatus Limnocylindrales bacterium]|nr:SDR family oxidoreductase [Candidatus Limnocylindrales bacterium]